MDIAAVRQMIANLEDAVEAPHHHLVSFRIRGKIFATMDQAGTFLNIFVDETTREQALFMHPEACDKVWWGKKVMGLKVHLDTASEMDIAALLASAYQAKAS